MIALLIDDSSTFFQNLTCSFENFFSEFCGFRRKRIGCNIDTTITNELRDPLVNLYAEKFFHAL